MLGLGPISDAPLSSLSEGLSPAVLTANGIGAFSAVGQSSAAAALSASGVGAASFVGASVATSVLSAAGSGTFAASSASSASSVLSASGLGVFSPIGASTATASFVFLGQSRVQFYTVPPTPANRTALVPLRSRGLLLKRDSRLQPVPATSRELSPFPVSRNVVVPLYPRIDMPLNWPSKDPDEKLDYSLNWSQVLSGDTIVSSDWDISDSSLVEADATNTSTSATIWLEDGTLNQSYVVTNTITTAAGRIFQQSVAIRILAN